MYQLLPIAALFFLIVSCSDASSSDKDALIYDDRAGSQQADLDVPSPMVFIELLDSHRRKYISQEELIDTISTLYCDFYARFDIEKGAKMHADFLKSQYDAGRYNLRQKTNFEESGGYDAELFKRCESMMMGASKTAFLRMGEDNFEAAMLQKCGDAHRLYTSLKKASDEAYSKAHLELDYYVPEGATAEWGDERYKALQQHDREMAKRAAN